MAITPVGLRAQVSFSVSAAGSRVEHRVDAGTGIERTSGIVPGGELLIRPSRRLEFRSRFAGGTLRSDSTTVPERDYAALEISAGLVPVDWLTFSLGTAIRSFGNQLARQRWTEVFLGADARFVLLDGPVATLVGMRLIPASRVSGLPDPETAFGASAGIAYDRGSIRGMLLYSLQRVDFPPGQSGTARSEQLGSLTAAFGITLGDR